MIRNHSYYYGSELRRSVRFFNKRHRRRIIRKEFIDFVKKQGIVYMLSHWTSTRSELDRNLALFGSGWYDLLPNGTRVTFEDGHTEFFQHGKTTNKTQRFGYLLFGIKFGVQ